MFSLHTHKILYKGHNMKIVKAAKCKLDKSEEDYIYSLNKGKKKQKLLREGNRKLLLPRANQRKQVPGQINLTSESIVIYIYIHT